MKLKRGDKVIVIVGSNRNKVGVIERVIPDKNKVVITGVNLARKHRKKSPKNPEGIISKEMPIDASNVMLLDPNTNKPTRIGFTFVQNKKMRKSKVTGQLIKDSNG